MPTNDELVAQAQDIELEGEETTTVVQAVADKFGEISAQIAAAQQEIDALKASAMTDAQRDSITNSLANAKTLSDNAQAVLTALVTPPAEG
jgi:uncharacterized coiled-coil DUF342 family protein